MMIFRKKKIFLPFFVCILFVTNAVSQNIDIKNKSYFYPHKQEPGSYIHTLGLRVASLPEDIVESDDDFRAPLFFYGGRLGVTENFSAEGSIESNFITLQAAVGPRWTHEFERLNFSIGGDASYFLGELHQFDFRTRIIGWNIYPNLSIGYSFPNFSVSMKAEIILVVDQTVKTGSVEVTSDFKTFSGYSVALFLEQPLWQSRFVVLGMKANFTRFYYPMWITFSTFDRLFFIPELILSFNLWAD